MKKFLNKKVVKIAGIILLILIAATPSYYFYSQNQKAQKRLQNPETFAKEESQALVKRVGLLIDLPTEEEPTIATISDKEKLKDQPFFTKAKNGDKVIIYTNARKAILYDPIANKIIDVAPVNIGPNNLSSPSATIGNITPSPSSQSFKLFLLNGTATTGLTKKYEEALKGILPQAVVVDRDNAKKQDYQKTILVDLSGTKREESKQLATMLGIDVGNLPSGETKPEGADFLIIVGADKK